jgi:flagellar hook-associated protein 1 FlgK
MASTFGGIGICSGGMYSSQTKIYTSNVNINNASTPGYSRQVVKKNPDYITSVQDGSLVVGVNPNAMSVERERSTYLDYRYWQEQDTLGEYEYKSNYHNQMESILYELDDNGITARLDSLEQSMEDLSTNPQDLSGRTAVLQETEALCDTLNNTSQQLYELQDSVENDINYTVNRINQLSDEIANLNEEILELEMSGGNSSYLTDQRNLLIDELSKLTSVTVTENIVASSPDGGNIVSYTVKSGNSLLVSGNKSYSLETKESTSPEGYKNISVVWSDNGSAYEADSGALKGALDIMNGDGKSGDFKGIPYYMGELDDFANKIVEEINNIHMTGYGLDDSTNIPLFDPTCTDASSIKLSDEIKGNPEKLAVSSEAGKAGNSNNLKEIINQFNNPGTFQEGSYNDCINKLVTELGTQSSYSSGSLERASALSMDIDQNRMSVSGVSVDEEMTDIVFQQQIYEANAKMIKVWNDIIENTINQLGS